MWGVSAADLPLILLTIAWLVLLEGLLSADNALVLAVMVRHLPKSKQILALRYGIWGAFGFRAIAIVGASYLLNYWQLKAIGGLYLLYLAVSHFIFGDADGDGSRGGKDHSGVGFWMTVVKVELADIAFSIDSILAAVAMTEGLPARLQQNRPLCIGILYIGGVLGIIMMRLIAGVFLILLERFKGLAIAAYGLVGWIGLKLLGSGLHAWKPSWPLEIPAPLFWAVMIAIFVAGIVYRPKHVASPEISRDDIENSATIGSERGERD